MATFTIVSKDADPLGPNEIHAGDTIDVSNGDVFIVSASADDNITFEAATGNPTNFDIRFETSNTNDFNVEIMENLDAGINVSSGVDVSDIDIDADKALSIVATIGDNVSLGKLEGSESGADLITIGHGFSTDHHIDLRGGDNFLTIGDNASIQGIVTDGGADVITIGDGLVAKDIKTGDGDDAITIGDDAFLDNIETKEGNDSITIGDNLIADDIKTDDGADEISIGDGGLVDDIDTGKGDDTVSVGDFFTAHKVETKDGDDLVISGSGGSIDDLDGGNGNDTLDSETAYPDASNFETICFMRGTLIETETGHAQIENLRAGDRIRTLDHGMQMIRWIESSRFQGRGLQAPVRIAAGALGNARALWVSQQHRILMSGWSAQLNFGESEVLVPAKHLVGLSGIEIVELPSVEYFHMLFDRHEVVYSEGIETESFFPGAVGMEVLSQEACAKLYSVFPSLKSNSMSFGTTARHVLKSHEACLLAA